MGFSTALLLLAIIHAMAGIAAASRATKPIPATVAALVVAGASTIAATVVWLAATDWFGIFALSHVLYLAATVTVPVIAVAALGVAIRRRDDRVVARRWGAIGMLGLVPGVLGLYATHIEPGWLRVDRQELVTATGTAFRIGVLADVQNTTIGDHERDALQRLIDADVDLLLVPGDLWQMSDDRIEEVWPIYRTYVEAMVAGVGAVVIVEGDTDDVGQLRRVVDGTGAHLLADDHIDLIINGAPVRVGGTVLRSTYGPTDAAIEMLADLTAVDEETFTILLSHRPDAIEDLTTPVDLVVSGHTHGGQIAVPFFGPLVTFSDVPRAVAAGGLHEIDGQPIYVSTGVGLERGTAPQVRFNVRPSVGVIDVVADQSAASSAG